MAESVTVDHGGVSITTNTASEADLRTEMETPAASGDNSSAPGDNSPPAPPRNEKGRFVPKAGEVSAAAPEAPDAAPPADPAAPARRRDDTLPRHNPIARLNQALAQKAEADRRAAALEQELARYRQPAPVTGQVTPPAPPPQAAPAPAPSGPPEPQFEQFADQADPYTAYLQAWTRWDRAQGIAQARAEWDAAQAEKARTQSFQSRLAAGKTQYADFDTALQNADTLGLQVSAVMREAIADSPKAADLVYYLATHPEECTQLAEESVATPVAAATVMRRLLESQLAPRAAPSNASADLVYYLATHPEEYTQLAEESVTTPVAAATVMRRLLESHLAPRAAPSNGSGPAARAAVSTAKPPVTPVGSSPVVSDDPPGDQASAAEHARYWNRRLKVPGTR